MASIDESLDEARIIERALLRIKAIGLAKGVDEVTYRFGFASGAVKKVKASNDEQAVWRSSSIGSGEKRERGPAW
ncbi:hypothetical protein [Pseudomonas putida]|uniref:hypothetical protein n=1 Tax=Pseudomonas putida TaxID=303 RepID=UPI00390586B3